MEVPMFTVFDILNCRGHINDMPSGDPLRESGLQISAFLTHFVEQLRIYKTFPNQPVNRLAQLTWRLLGNRVVNCAVIQGESKLNFVIEAKRGLKFGMFVASEKWPALCIERPEFCMGMVVWASSLCRDYFHDRIRDPGRLINRAEMWEAEYLLTALNRKEFWLDRYQKRLLRQNPQGIHSRQSRRLLYPLRRKYMDAA
jgi:hypothetical protein